jgi:hypothetical protein
MLTSPPGPTDRAARHTAVERRRARQKAYRRRQHAGVVMVTIPVNAALVSLLVRAKWLPPREYHTRAEITAALVRMHAASAGDA